MKSTHHRHNLTALLSLTAACFACSPSVDPGPDPTGSGGGNGLGSGGMSSGGGTSPGSGGDSQSGGSPGDSSGGTDGVASGGSDSNASGGSSSGSSSGSGGASSGDPCTTATVCDDFESGMNSAWAIQKDSTPAPAVDTAKSNSGSSSLKVTGTSQQSFVALPVPGQAFYTRAYMNFEKDTMSMTGHGWFIVAADNVTSGGEAQIRFGSSSNHGHPELDVNVYAGTCGGEKTQFSDGASDGGAGWQGETTDSVNLSADTWYCVEVYFNGPGNEAQVWIDGTELSGLHVTETSMCAAWAPTFTHIKFGAGANSNIGDIWYDDVAVSTTRIGCN